MEQMYSSSFHFLDLACIVFVSQHHIVLHCMLLFLAQLKCPVIALVPFLGYPKQASNLILVCSRPSVRRTRWLLRLPTPSEPRPARGYAPAHPVARTMTVRAMSDPRFQLNITYQFNSKLLSTPHHRRQQETKTLHASAPSNR